MNKTRHKNTQRDRDNETRRASRPAEWARQVVLVIVLGAIIGATCSLATLVLGGAW